jgi:hypothetical protein
LPHYVVVLQNETIMQHRPPTPATQFLLEISMNKAVGGILPKMGQLIYPGRAVLRWNERLFLLACITTLSQKTLEPPEPFAPFAPGQPVVVSV